MFASIKRSFLIAHLVLFLIGFSGPAGAWDSFVGEEPCEFVVEQMQKEDETASLIIGAFVSGVNYATGRSVGADLEEMASWVQNYCTLNPSERFLDALLRLDEELDARQTTSESPETEAPHQDAEPAGDNGKPQS